MITSELRRTRVAVLAYFFVLGAGGATWAARLPAIKESLHLSDGRLGLALFAVPAGAVLTLTVSGRVTDAFGAVRVMRIAGVAVPAARPHPPGRRPAVADGRPGRLRRHGRAARRRDERLRRPSGGRLRTADPVLAARGLQHRRLAGAGIGGIFAWQDIGPLPTLITAACALVVLGLLAGPRIKIPPAPDSRAESPGDGPGLTPSQITLTIWILGLLALCGQLGEGSAGDWSAVYLHVNLGSPSGVAAVGLAAFSVTMAVGRMVGDRLSIRFGPVALVRVSGLLAGVGLAAGLLIGTAAAAIAGFALLGAGLAGIFPQIVSAAVRLDPARSGRNIGRIAAIAYSGLLGGPVVIGAAASGIGLRDALLIPAALAALVGVAANVMRPSRAR